MQKPKKEGETPLLKPSALGGAVTLLTLGAIIALMSTTLVTYAQANTLLKSSLLPVTRPQLAAYTLLPCQPALPTIFLGFNISSTLSKHLSASGARPNKPGSGISVAIETMGNLCGSLVANSSHLYKGEFAYTSTVTAATGYSLHFFSCPDCMPDDLAFLSASFDTSCQSFVVSVFATGSGGGVTMTSVTAVAPGASAMGAADVTFPVILEAIQDTTLGAVPRAADGLVVGARSAVGYLANGASPATIMPLAAGAAAIELTIRLPLVSSFVMNQLTPIMSPGQLAGALAAWLTLLSSGAILLTIHKSVADFKMPGSNKGAVGGGRDSGEGAAKVAPG